MTTLFLANVKQDSSFGGEWTEAYDATDTSLGILWHRHSRHRMTHSFSQMVGRILFVDEDIRAAAKKQWEFEQLAAEWKRETEHLSSPNAIAEHRAYQEIIGMGKEAIPMILRDLAKTQAPWFWALRSIARESPVRPEDRGDVDAMTYTWLDWGRLRHYI